MRDGGLFNFAFFREERMEQITLWKGFQKPKHLVPDSETMTDKYGRFYAQPFERGFGITIGNSLRRALLSSIEGAGHHGRQDRRRTARIFVYSRRG